MNVYFIEDNELLGVGARHTPICVHYFCRSCGREFAQALVDNPQPRGHTTLCLLCPQCYLSEPYPEIAPPVLRCLEYPTEEVLYPIEVYRRDFLVLSARLLESP